MRSVAGPRRAGRTRGSRAARRRQPAGCRAARRRAAATRWSPRAPTRSRTASTSRSSDAEAITDGDRVSVHHGTSRIAARVVRVGDRYAQLRLERPVVAARGDRVVLRARDDARRRSRPRPRAAPTSRRAAASSSSSAVEIAATDPRARPPRRASARAGRRARGRPPSRGPGRSRRPGWRSSRTELRARIEAADPLDPGSPSPRIPGRRTSSPLLPFERRGAKLVLPGTRSSLGDRDGKPSSS